MPFNALSALVLDNVYTNIYPKITNPKHTRGRAKMRTARITKVFKSGNSQAVRVPKGFYETGEELSVQKIGSSLVLTPRNDPWRLFKQSLEEFTEDFLQDGRKQPDMQERES
jgi:antitoxin VapB